MTRARLIREAKDGLRFRGHVIGRFTHVAAYAYYTCPACGARVMAKEKPWYNEIALGGDALAINCVGSKLAMYK